jgi:hypothetical protein
MILLYKTWHNASIEFLLNSLFLFLNLDKITYSSMSELNRPCF